MFDTIATEAQRQLYENFSMFIRNFLPKYPQPDADAIENLNMAVIVDQKRLGGGSHSTVGTITDIYTVLRLLFSRVGKPYVGLRERVLVQRSAGHVPGVQRPRARSSASISDDFLDMSQVAQRGRGAGAVLRRLGGCNAYAASRLLRQRQEAVELHARGDGAAAPRQGPKFKTTFGDGTINVDATRASSRSSSAPYIKRDLKTLPERTQKAVEPYLTMGPCPLCKGARLSQAALASKIDGHNIAELSAMEIGELIP